MKSWMIGLLALGMLVGSYQPAPAAVHRIKAAKAARVEYVCPSCGVAASDTSPCPVCKRPMAHVANFVCMKCQISTDAAGPCPSCHEPMQKIGAQYRKCSSCGFFYPRFRKACPVCAKRQKK